MNAKRAILTVYGIIAAIAMISALFNLLEDRRMEEVLKGIAKEHLAIDEQMERARDEIARSDRTRLSLEMNLKELRDREAALTMNSDQRDLAIVANDPKVHALYLKSYRARLFLVYNSFYKSLGLTEAQIDKFEDAKAKNHEGRVDLAVAANSQGVASSDSAIAALQLQEDEQARTAEIGILGQDGYQQLQQFNRTQALGSLMEDMSSALAYGPAPITAAQAAQLQSILANASATYQSNEATSTATIDWNQVLSQAQGFLSQPQLATLKAEAQNVQVQVLAKRFFLSQPAP
jgi:hypothetical protein